ncbi:response regulator [Rhizobium tubonense]|uniref:DNA-binding response regulator n=1 Tax=Rhizobium tubonense TaxID=484088 RepID=A0A2W4F356_9HYPH|nr:response regulator transcription factor [Rhizobium tubonense]PZM16403.1 DNA-binding response regulator [Rhizobium tubonense]
MTGEIKIAVIDDHPLFREGVSRSLAEIEGFMIVAEGGNCEDAIRIAETLKPDVILMDISMPGGGLEALRQILQREPEQKIVMLTVSEMNDDVTRALDYGAMGYALKGVGSRLLAEIIRTVSSGRTYVAPTLSAQLISTGGNSKQARMRRLTARERGVLELVAQGLSNKHIAIRLDLHEKTIKHHMTQILAKLEVSNRTEAALALRDAANNH